MNIYDVKGSYIGRFGNSGIESENINNPTGLAISHINGEIYVCDKDKDIVQGAPKVLQRNFKIRKILIYLQ